MEWRSQNTGSVSRRNRYASDPVYAEKQRAASRNRHAANREQSKQAMRERYRKNCSREGFKESVRKGRLKLRYGITPESWMALFESQGRCCAICKTTEPGSKRGWHTDHCHDTKKVRGILCLRCNVMLGHLKPELLSVALNYLQLK